MSEKPKVWGVQLSYGDSLMDQNNPVVKLCEGNVVVHYLSEKEKRRTGGKLMKLKCTINSSGNFTIQPESGTDAERQFYLRVLIKACNNRGDNVMVWEEDGRRVKMKILFINVATSTRTGSRLVVWDDFLASDDLAEFIEIRKKGNEGIESEINSHVKRTAPSAYQRTVLLATTTVEPEKKPGFPKFENNNYEEEENNVAERLAGNHQVLTSAAALFCLSNMESCCQLLRTYIEQKITSESRDE